MLSYEIQCSSLIKFLCMVETTCTLKLALLFSGDRGTDLAQVKTAEVMCFPDNSGFLFNHIWTKSLRNGDANVFAFKRGCTLDTCPVAGIEMYFKIAAAMGIELTRGFMFKALTKEGKVSSEAFSAAAAQMRLREYCNSLADNWHSHHFTIHSFRGGAAISLALLDVPIHDTASAGNPADKRCIT